LRARKREKKPKTQAGPADNQPPQAPPPARPRARFWGFHLVALLGLPLILLLVLEGLLRAFGYGYPTSFFLDTQREGKAVWIDNQDFGRRFFPPGLVRYPRPTTFAKIKSPGTLRVFVLGESAAMGDPDFKFGLPRMLEVLLRERFPGRPIEVITTAMVAINSHVILPIAEDVAPCQADLWVVYMGNNEMVGPFGSASIFGRQVPPVPLVRTGLALKTTRLGQGMDAWLHWARRGNQPLPEWGGMEMMADQRVRSDAPETQRVYRNFDRNLRNILEIGSRHGVPILLCTVASNLKDCAPFASVHRPDLAGADLTTWQSAYEAGVTLQATGQLAEAQTQYARAEQLDSAFADLAFRRAQCFLRAGSEAEALRYFRQARDLDALQFRADGRINGIIRRRAAEFTTRQVRLLDTELLVSTSSPQGLPGAELFYEHVHLTPEGNYLLARAMAEAAAPMLGVRSEGQWVAQDQCLDLLGLTDWNRHDAFEIILDRIQGPPFSHQIDHELNVRRAKEGLARYRLATKPAQAKRDLQRVLPLTTRFPADPDLRWNAASLLEVVGDTAGAEAQWRSVIQLQPQAALPRFNLARLLDRTGRPEEALTFYQESLRINPEYYAGRMALGSLCLRLGRWPEAIRHLASASKQKPRSTEPRLALSQALARTGRLEEARQQLQEVLQVDPKNSTAQTALETLEAPDR
jgi:tetratricopeptide (TPR) repeat protein